MIIPVKYSIKVFGNDSFEMSLTWKDEDGNVFDLSGKNALMPFYVSDAERTNTKVLSTTPSAGGSVITLAATAPNVVVLIVAGETGVGVDDLSFTQEPGYFILHIINSATLVDRLMEGRVRYEL